MRSFLISMKPVRLVAVTLTTVIVFACGGSSSNNSNAATQTNPAGSAAAAVTAVAVSGESGNYTFSVTIESPDTGCDQYADWWEVLSADGRLVYRRILAHSHVTEQPFERSGGPVNIVSDENIIVRAHMNNTGYGAQVFSGNVDQGLSIETQNTAISAELAFVDPLPADCAF